MKESITYDLELKKKRKGDILNKTIKERTVCFIKKSLEITVMSSWIALTFREANVILNQI